LPQTEVLFTQNQNSDMRNRTEILKDLILLQADINDLEKELSQYPWDAEEPLLKVSKVDFIFVFQKCIDNEISFDELLNWANAIECRDDLDFANEEMQEIVFELASPEINREITNERLKEIINELGQ
jgi:thioester reductase-like protein